MDKAKFLTIYPTFEKLEIVKKVLPSIIAETMRNDARLIVHDSSVRDRQKKWEYLLELNKNEDFFLLLSSNLSMAHARNTCLQLGIEMYAPEYICVLEDDHGYHKNVIPFLIESMELYYGKISPNNLRFGLFSACRAHNHANFQVLEKGRYYPHAKEHPLEIAGPNSCFRCAPTSHWLCVLKGYDTDEYLISQHQTLNLRRRNYHKGYTVMYVGDELSFFHDEDGRGATNDNSLKLWDSEYCASDDRSRYIGKKNKNDS